MRVIVVGNGIAGVMCSKFLRDRGLQADIDIFTDEKYDYYPRPNLIEFLAGRIPENRLFAFKEEWYLEKNLNVHLETPVHSIVSEEGKLVTGGEKEEKYDILVLANGSRPFIPPIQGTDKKRVLSLRTLDDCYEIMDCLETHPNVTVLGGGLLGLEIARALITRGVSVQVFEFSPRLLPRQLDEKGASLLKKQIENMGISINLGMTCEEILGSGEVSGLRFKDGRTFTTEVVIVAAGVKPDVQLAAQAGLRTERGVMVDEQLQTSDPKIYALGDNVEFDGKTYGIIPAAFEQAKAVAAAVAGEKIEYTGTIPSNSLKVAGLDVTSIGVANPEDNESIELRTFDEKTGVYKKIVVRENILIGAIVMGTKKRVPDFSRLILEKTDIGRWKERLLEDDFDLSGL